MFIVKGVMQGVGETLFLRYNLMGDALAVYAKFKHRQLWHEAATTEAPVTEEFKDDHGVTAMVPAHGMIFTQIIALEPFMEADAKQNVRQQLIMQNAITKAQSGGLIQPPPGANGAFRQ
jgi:hypothetical protein